VISSKSTTHDVDKPVDFPRRRTSDTHPVTAGSRRHAGQSLSPSHAWWADRWLAFISGSDGLVPGGGGGSAGLGGVTGSCRRGLILGAWFLLNPMKIGVRVLRPPSADFKETPGRRQVKQSGVESTGEVWGRCPLLSLWVGSGDTI